METCQELGLSVCIDKSSGANSANPLFVSAFSALLGAATGGVGLCPRTMMIWQRQFQRDHDPYAISPEHRLTWGRGGGDEGMEARSWREMLKLIMGRGTGKTEELGERNGDASKRTLSVLMREEEIRDFCYYRWC